MKSLSQNPLIVVLLLGITAFSFSCKKEKPTLAKIQVVKIDNTPMADVEVKLWPNPSPVLGAMIDPVFLQTDEDGIAIFDFTDDHDLGTAGFRVLDIAANSGDTLLGIGIIKIIEEEENFKKVVIAAP